MRRPRRWPRSPRRSRLRLRRSGSRPPPTVPPTVRRGCRPPGSRPAGAATPGASGACPAVSAAAAARDPHTLRRGGSEVSSVEVRDAEVMTVGADEVVVTFVTEPGEKVESRVGDHEATTVGPHHFATFTELAPGTKYAVEVDGAA